MSLRQNVRNFLLPMTLPELRRELELSMESGDEERAGYIDEFIREVEADFNECETPDL